jgi:hypothetical protein
MLRNRLLIVVAIVVTGALVAGGIVVAVRKFGHSVPTASALGVNAGVSLGGVTPQATQITVGGRTYPLQPGQEGTRNGRIVLTSDAGGVAVVRDRAGHVLATAPVWAVPGQPPKAAEATCRSTAFDQFLLTPGVVGPDPLGVDLLWSLAGRGQTAHDVAVLGRLICVGLKRDPGHLSHPSQAEITAYKKIFTDYATQLPQLASQMPALASSAAGIRSELAASAPSTHATADRWPDHGKGLPASSGTYATADRTSYGRQPSAELTSARVSADSAPGACADNFLPVSTAAGSTSALALCTDGRDVDAENNSAAWAFLYSVPPAQNDGPGIPRLPSAIVPGRTSDFPSIERIVGAIAHDYIAGVEQTACTVLSFVDVCHAAKKPPKSAVSALFNLVEAGTVTARASAGYYSIAWGDGKGDQSTFSAGATMQSEQTEARYSEDLTFVSSVIAPTVGLVLDHQIDLNLPPDQLPLLLPVFNELARSALQLGVHGAPTTISGHLHAVVGTARTLFANPALLTDIFAAFSFPTFHKVSKALAEQLAEYLAGLEIPVAGWAALLVKLVAKGSSAATLVLSIAGMFDALTEPSYSSWTPVLTADAARNLRLFSPSASPNCPAPTPPVAVPAGAPGVPTCEWVVSADLDGNGKPDRLVAWQTADRRGAVAYLDDGSTHPLQAQPSALADSTDPWAQVISGFKWDTNQPLQILQLTGSARQQVLLIDSIGAVGDEAVLVGLGGDGGLRLAANEQGQVQTILTAANLGCASQPGKRLFVEGVLGRGEPGVSGGPFPGYGVSRSFYQLSADLRMRFVGYQGQVLSSAPASDPFHNGCAGSIPGAGSIYQWATTAQQAINGLLAAANSRNEGRASAFVGGSYADFSGEKQFVPDVWKYLTATQGVSPANWMNRPVSCASSSDSANCVVTGSDGQPLAAEVDSTGDNWVVTGMEAG